MRVYVASPLGFAASTKPFLESLLRAVQETGAEPVDPWSLPESRLLDEARNLAPGDERLRRLRQANREIAAANESALRSSDVVVAVLDGVDIDSGTAAELGVAYEMKKPIIGLRTDLRRAGENEAAVVNLQVQYFIETSGGAIVRSLDELKAALASSLATSSRR